MSADCQFFQNFITELKPNDDSYKTSVNCCDWDMVTCEEGNNIVKVDLSNFKFGLSGPLPQSVATLTHLKEFSLRGQNKITEIYNLSVEHLEKLDLSKTKLNLQTFPIWLLDAPKLKELDISETEITGIPQRQFKSQLSKCNFAKTPICSTYQNSAFKDTIPEVCITSCTKGSAVKSSNGDDSEGSGIPSFVILIGVAIVLFAGIGAFLYFKKSKKNKTFEDYSPQQNNNIKRDDSIEITVNDKAPLTPKANLPAVTAVNNNQSYDNNNYNENVAIDPEQSYQVHPSIYNTMITDVDSDEDNSNIINGPIVGNTQDHIPSVLRRKSSRKANLNANDSENQQYAAQRQDDLYIANWDYTPTLPDELALTAGDVIEIRKKFDDGWCNGYNRKTKLTGIVPLCYLKEYEE